MGVQDIDTVETLFAAWRSHQAEIDAIKNRLLELLGDQGGGTSSVAPPLPQSSLQVNFPKPNWPLGAVMEGTKGHRILEIIARRGGNATIAQIVGDFLGKKVWERSEYLRVLQGIRYISQDDQGFLETVERGKVRLTQKGESTLKWMEANHG